MDAHVNADATEQWIEVHLREGKQFDAQAIAARVPDCGYKLRRIELTAVGEVVDGHFVVASNGQRFPYKSREKAIGVGRMHGAFEPPIAAEPQLVIKSWTTDLPAPAGTSN